MSFARSLAVIALVVLGLAFVPSAPSHGAAQLARAVGGGGGGGAGGPVIILVTGLRSDRGEVMGGLYDRAATWLGEDEAVEDCHAPIQGGRARCVFHSTSAHTVAFAAMHDEDGDGELDRDLVGIPSEGYAFSNDVREPFGPPSFEAAAFSPVRTSPFVVHVRYGI